MAPFCSIIVVNYNGAKHLDACLRSLEQLDYPSDQLEILLVDNGSQDGSDQRAVAEHPRVELLRNPTNNFPAALNLGIRRARGNYIGFVNNDVFVDPSWLRELVGTLEVNPRAGCAGGKILFENGRINSVGHQALGDFYWIDEGFGEEDKGQYDREREVEGLCWAAVLLRQSCLDDLGPIDEDYVLYCEDVDTARRCLQRGWKILYTPRAVVRHVFHGSGRDNYLVEYFCDRGRLLYVAKYHPEKLADAVATSRFRLRGDWDSLYYLQPLLIRKLVRGHPPETVEPALENLCQVLISFFGRLAVHHLLKRVEVILGLRKISVGFYDHVLHVIGGGQKYGCTMAASLQEDFDITMIANRPVTAADLEQWYRLRLSRCQLTVIPLPYFDRCGAWIDSNVVSADAPNPFEAIATASADFDIFVNVNMLTIVRPLSPFSLFVCHFPDTPRRGYFAVDQYSALIANSLYTTGWMRALWGLEPTFLLYPPADAENAQIEKENLILSVSRFEPGGSKKQYELIRVFEGLWASHREILQGWRLVLAGGSLPDNRYLMEIKRQAQRSPAPIEVRENLAFSDLQALYGRAKIFWHACGIGETNPHLIEHFGMSTVEAMQNRCIPVVFDGGGQREIVEHGRSGFRFATLKELSHHTVDLIRTPGKMEEIQSAIYARAQAFARQHFEALVRSFFTALAEEYQTVPLCDPRSILERKRRPNLFFSPVARRTLFLTQVLGKTVTPSAPTEERIKVSALIP